MSRKVPLDVSKEQVESAIDQWIMGRNAERNKAIVSRHIFYGITLEKLAEEFDLSRRQVWDIIDKNENYIFKQLKKIAK